MFKSLDTQVPIIMSSFFLHFHFLPISYNICMICEIIQDLTKILASSYSDLIKIVSHVLLKVITSRKSRKT